MLEFMNFFGILKLLFSSLFFGIVLKMIVKSVLYMIGIERMEKELKDEKNKRNDTNA